MPELSPALPHDAAKAMAVLHPRQKPSATVLLVEDSRTAAEALRLIAQRAGLRMRRVETLAAARAHLRLYRADAVLVDLGLPDGSGLDLISQMARSPFRPRHIAAISGDGEGRMPALMAGADCFVLKPFTTGRGVAHIFGPAWPPRPEARGGTSGDPIALSDDLNRGAAMLAGGSAQAACRFLIGVARCAGDEGLRAAAEAALSGEPGTLETLHALLEQRQCQRPLI